MPKAKFVDKSKGKTFMVTSGTHYSGCVGECLESTKLKGLGVWLKLELSDCDTWFSVDQVKEF